MMNVKKEERMHITICMGSSCFARGNGENLDIIERYLAENQLQARVELVGSRCEGLCAEGPNLIINDHLFQKVDSGMLLDILHEYCPVKEETRE